MLVAELAGTRAEAETSVKGPTYNCPKCKTVVFLKQGRKVVWHFAHKPPTDCTWATGETKAHLEAKTFVAKVLRDRGLKAEVEYVFHARRADVMTFKNDAVGPKIAIELQHCAVQLDELEQRAFSYAKSNIAQIWIPFIPKSVWDRDNGGWFGGKWVVRRYSAKPFERWIHGFNGNRGMWMYDPGAKQFWHARLDKHEIYVEATSWFESGGYEQSAGGYSRTSKRYKELTLSGPHEFADLRIKVETRKPFRVTGYNWPGGAVAHLIKVNTDKRP